MAGDKETLLSMGFDTARVDWALKATGNRGLQPAMDHILEHDGEPIPELGGVAEQSRSAPMSVDKEDEDMEALRSLNLQATTDEAKSTKCAEYGVSR